MPQKPGFHLEMLDWMAKEAERLAIPATGKEGGLIFDEMSLQVGNNNMYGIDDSHYTSSNIAAGL